MAAAGCARAPVFCVSSYRLQKRNLSIPVQKNAGSSELEPAL